MAKRITTFEQGLADFLAGKETDEYRALMDAVDEGFDDRIHEEVEIAIVPGRSKSSLDGLWIETLGGNTRIGAYLAPGPELRNFFSVINVHPRDVLVTEDFRITPAEDDSGQVGSYMNPSYRQHVNEANTKVVEGFLDLLTNFEVDPERPALCSPQDARNIMDNASYGGFPAMAGYARISDILALDFDKPITIGGRYMVGLYDNVNGSGYMDGATAPEFNWKLEKGDLIVCREKGFTPMDIFSFVGYYYQLNLSNAVEETPKSENTV